MAEYSDGRLRELYFDAFEKRELKEAIEFRKQIIERGNGNLDDYFTVGECLFEIGEYAQCVDMLTHCINMGLEQNDSWYQSAAYTLRAYGLIKVGKYNEAMFDISNIQNNEGVFWLRNHPEIDKKLLEKFLKSEVGHSSVNKKRSK